MARFDYQVSEALDLIGNEPGGIIYRGATQWEFLPRPTVTSVLTIGASGYPEWVEGEVASGIDSGWILLSLINGVQDATSGSSPPQYRRNSSGIVNVQFQVNNGNGTNPQVIAVLPVDFRPPQNVWFRYDANATGRVMVIRTDGQLRLFGFSSAISRACLTFQRDPVTA